MPFICFFSCTICYLAKSTQPDISKNISLSVRQLINLRAKLLLSPPVHVDGLVLLDVVGEGGLEPDVSDSSSYVINAHSPRVNSCAMICDAIIQSTVGTLTLG